MMHELISRKELESCIAMHEFLIPGDVCIKLDTNSPVVISHSYASEYYAYGEYSDKEAIKKSLNQYYIYTQGSDGIWKSSYWTDRAVLSYVGHIDEQKLYMIKLMAKLRIKSDRVRLSELVSSDATPHKYLATGDICEYRSPDFPNTVHSVYIIGSKAVLDVTNVDYSHPGEDDFNIYRIMYSSGSIGSWVHRSNLIFIQHNYTDFMELFRSSFL